jgi:hypothetical protein
VTPSKFKTVTWEETVKICRDYTTTAIQALGSLPRKEGQPLRFIYISGHFAPRERKESIKQLEDHGLSEMAYMRVFKRLLYMHWFPLVFYLI